MRWFWFSWYRLWRITGDDGLGRTLRPRLLARGGIHLLSGDDSTGGRWKPNGLLLFPRVGNKELDMGGQSRLDCARALALTKISRDLTVICLVLIRERLKSHGVEYAFFDAKSRFDTNDWIKR